MFKKFTKEESVSGTTLVKASVQRGIRNKVLDQYPSLEEYIDTLMPKKCALSLVKCHDKISIVSVDGELLFFSHHDGPLIPTMRILHLFPDMMTKQQVDKGAIRFVLSGANIMCPGLTSPGASMNDAEADSIVAIYAEGKEHAVAIGKMTMSSDDIKTKNKGIGIENLHYLNDGLWRFDL